MLSVAETKEILGEEYKNCSDDEIQEMIDSAYMLADIFIDGVLDVEDKKEN